ncbi:MAG: sulfatase-like hydrolase/transferase, partial [Leptospira sp.]|nr:sulfatase-like hydrolase/transferase [Leptospira sp.]
SGVLHLNTNHFPYYTPINYEKWPVFDNVINGYDNSVYYFDSLISRVFDSLKENSMMENTIVFITSDHGEAIFDHNYLGHIDNNYIETVSIPMMIYIPEKLQNNFSMAALEKNKDVNVFNSDIIPTMIDFWKIRETGEINKLGKNFTGTSLFRSIDPERKILIANNNPTSLYRVGFGLISGKMNYLVRINSTPKTEELYDFSRDPLEADNLWPKINDDTRRNYHRAVQDCIICRSLYDDAGIQFLEN